VLLTCHDFEISPKTFKNEEIIRKNVSDPYVANFLPILEEWVQNCLFPPTFSSLHLVVKAQKAFISLSRTKAELSAPHNWKNSTDLGRASTLSHSLLSSGLLWSKLLLCPKVRVWRGRGGKGIKHWINATEGGDDFTLCGGQILEYESKRLAIRTETPSLSFVYFLDTFAGLS